MILSYSHENVFTTNLPPQKHNHRPYFLCLDKGSGVPKLHKSVTEIGAIEYYDSWVNWGKSKDKIPVRRVYLTHPSVTPQVSNVYYKAGYPNYENGVPYLQRVTCDMCAEGKWPLVTKGKEEIINCLIYDFEVIKGFISCCGIGEFRLGITSDMDLDTEKFNINFRLIDPEPNVRQLLASNINEELNNVILPFIRILKDSHLLIGQNTLSFDNGELYQRLNEYSNNKEISEFLSTYYYKHNAFYRGRTSDSFEIYPISFDTLLASRFLFKDFAEGQYGLKTLAPLLGVDVTQFNTRNNSYNKRILERDFKGFGYWDNDNELCLQYNKDDIYETYGIFLKMYKEILTYMFITGMPFQEVVSGSNTKIADYLTLIRSYRKTIAPPVVEPIKVARALMYHFKGETPSKSEIFEYFRNHTCTQQCLTGFYKASTNQTLDKMQEDLDEEEKEMDSRQFDTMINKLYRCVRYGEEMPEYVEYYPLLLDYLSVGGLVYEPREVLTPLHNVYKGDVSAQYPSILKAKNIVSNTVRLARKGEKPDGWCWFRVIGNTQILDKFEWKIADEEYIDKKDEYPKQYMIGYMQKGEEGILTKALSGIMDITARYKKIPEWQEVYQRTLKPLRNAMTHGALLALSATSMQYNIAGTAIPTYGQIITNKLVREFNKAGWRLLEADTDGAEFVKDIPDAKDFATVIAEVEDYWNKQFGYPISFDIEHHAHKVYLAHKNYVTIKDNKVKLTGATLHASDKPNIAEAVMKELMLKILPISNTKDEFLSNIRQYASKIINDKFNNINIKDLVMISSIKPANTYQNQNYKARVEAIESLLKNRIIFPTKIEFLVTKKPLENVIARKTDADPVSYMWPRNIVEENHMEIDVEWYKNMIYSYIDSAFKLDKASSRYAMRSLSEFGETPVEKKPEEPKESKFGYAKPGVKLSQKRLF